MSWFRSTPDPSANAQRPVPFDPAATRIAAGTRIVGRLEGPAEVALEGELVGDARLEGALLVGSKGVVTGNLDAATVRIAGKVTGNVHGRERIELLGGGCVEGDLAAPRVVVAEGAFLSGKVIMHELPPASRAPSGVPGAANKGVEAASAAPPAEPKVAAPPPPEPDSATAKVAAEASTPSPEAPSRRSHRERERGPKNAST